MVSVQHQIFKIIYLIHSNPKSLFLSLSVYFSLLTHYVFNRMPFSFSSPYTEMQQPLAPITDEMSESITPRKQALRSMKQSRNQCGQQGDFDHTFSQMGPLDLFYCTVLSTIHNTLLSSLFLSNSRFLYLRQSSFFIHASETAIKLQFIILKSLCLPPSGREDADQKELQEQEIRNQNQNQCTSCENIET